MLGCPSEVLYSIEQRKENEHDELEICAGLQSCWDHRGSCCIQRDFKRLEKQANKNLSLKESKWYPGLQCEECNQQVK